MIDKILSNFQPVTEYGKDFFKELQPVIKNKREFCEHWERLQKVLELDRPTIQTIRDHLVLLGCIKQQIENGFDSIGDFAKLKRFVYYVMKISDLVKGIWNLPNLTGLWKILAKLTSESLNFYLQSEKLLDLRKKYLSISRKIEEKLKSLKDEIEKKFSVKLPGEEFTCDRQLGERLLNENLVEVIRRSNERYHLRIRYSQEILELSDQLKMVEDQMKTEEGTILNELSKAVDHFLNTLKLCERLVQQIDLDLCRYYFYFNMNCRKPQISDELVIKGGRFPPIVEYCEENDYTYYPVNVDAAEGVTVLYGPNMGGKTSLLRTVGSLVVLMQLGFPVPCEVFSSPIFDSVRYLSKGEELGLSSFAREISSFVSIVETLGKKLILIDEFGSTTNPIEGEALAFAITKYLDEFDDFAFFTTHYPAIVKSASNVYMCGKIKDADAIDPHKMIDYSLRKGKDFDQNVAITVARRFGLPDEVIQIAHDFMKKGGSCGKNLYSE